MKTQYRGLLYRFVILAFAFTPACGDPEIEVRPVPSWVREKFVAQCSACHGPDGNGRGHSSQTLEVKPPDWTIADWHHQSDPIRMREVIVQGSAPVTGSGSMPGFPDLASDKELEEMINLIRSFAVGKTDAVTE